jgi:D-glycero-alpha-D-manno-heptose-7-phosphate kinase
MIISRTPLRISLMGAGSDLADYYRKEPGSAVSAALQKFIYVAVNPHFHDSLRISYEKTEVVDDVDQLQNRLARGALKLCGVTRGVEVVTMADVPLKGSGLGATSAYLVGLLNALWAYQGIFKPQRALAEEACAIRSEAGEQAGKCSAYMAAHGGVQLLRFNPDESVFVDPVICRKETRRAVEQSLLLFYVGVAAPTENPPACDRCDEEDRHAALREMVEMAREVDGIVRSNQHLDSIGELLQHGWEISCGLADGMGPELEQLYARAREAGALGGRFTGPGGGFLLLWVERQNQSRVREALRPYRELPVRLEPQGSRIIHVEE